MIGSYQTRDYKSHSLSSHPPADPKSGLSISKRQHFDYGGRNTHPIRAGINEGAEAKSSSNRDKRGAGDYIKARSSRAFLSDGKDF
jgi:hypothetical protein